MELTHLGDKCDGNFFPELTEGSKESFPNQNVAETFLCPELVEGRFPQWKAEAFRYMGKQLGKTFLSCAFR